MQPEYRPSESLISSRPALVKKNRDQKTTANRCYGTANFYTACSWLSISKDDRKSQRATSGIWSVAGDRRHWPRTWSRLHPRWNKVIYIYPTYLSLNFTKNSYYSELKHVWKPLPVFSSVGSLPKEWQRRQVEYFQPSTFQLLWKPLCLIIYSRSLSILSHFSRAAV